MKSFEKKIGVEMVKRLVKKRNQVLGAIYRKMDTDRGRAYKSPLLKLRKRYAISMEDVHKDTGIKLTVLRKIEADEPRMRVASRTLIKLADYFEVKYWKNLVTGDR